MKKNFKEYLEFVEFIEKHGVLYACENFSWANQIAQMLPNIKLDLPTTEKRAKIEYVVNNKNPIMIQLEDGSKLYFTLDEFKRIQGRPEKGKTLVVHFQRIPNDQIQLPSQITHCQVI